MVSVLLEKEIFLQLVTVPPWQAGNQKRGGSPPVYDTRNKWDQGSLQLPEIELFGGMLCPILQSRRDWPSPRRPWAARLPEYLAKLFIVNGSAWRVVTLIGEEERLR
jgi:hypothetical protein